MAYAEWAESAVPHLTGEEGGRWLDRMEASTTTCEPP